MASGTWLGAADLELTEPAGRAPADPATDAALSPLTRRQQAIAALARRAGVIRRADVRNHFGVSGETARRELTRLVQHGVFVRRGAYRGAAYHLRIDGGGNP